ncbi:hypothetical protein C0Q58_17185 [Streptomyces albidoflavus]|nr:hypothetical protein C0Q58_17185 [Streptomyces albidoflavus]
MPLRAGGVGLGSGLGRPWGVLKRRTGLILSSGAGRARCPQAPDRLSVLKRRTGLNQPAGRRSLSAGPRASLPRSEPGPRFNRCVRDLSSVRQRLDGSTWDLSRSGGSPDPAPRDLNHVRAQSQPVRRLRTPSPSGA